MNNHEHYTYAMRCQKLGSHWQSKKRARESELSWSFVCRARVHDLHDAMCKCKRKNSDARPADLCSRAPSKQVEARRREQEIEIERERERERGTKVQSPMARSRVFCCNPIRNPLATLAASTFAQRRLHSLAVCFTWFYSGGAGLRQSVVCIRV